MSDKFRSPELQDKKSIKIIDTFENKLQHGSVIGCKLQTPKGEVKLIWYADYPEKDGSTNPNGEIYMEARMEKEKAREDMLSPHGFIVIEDQGGDQSIWGWGHTGNYPNETFDGKKGDVITPLLGRKENSRSYDFDEDLLTEEKKEKRIEEFQKKYYYGEFAPEDIKKLSPDAKRAWVVKDSKTVNPIVMSS